MDDVDRATQRIEEISSDALAKLRRQMPQGESARFCQADGCGERIPAARRRALPGVQHCVDCAQDAEYRRGLKKYGK